MKQEWLVIRCFVNRDVGTCLSADTNHIALAGSRGFCECTCIREVALPHFRVIVQFALIFDRGAVLECFFVLRICMFVRNSRCGRNANWLALGGGLHSKPVHLIGSIK